MLQNSSNEAMRGIFTAQIHWIEFQQASEVPVRSRTEHEGSDVTIGDNQSQLECSVSNIDFIY